MKQLQHFKSDQYLHILSLFLALIINLVHANQQSIISWKFCVTNRHVHLSTQSDASTSVIISFSSHPCDVLTNGVLRSNELVKPNRGGVIISTDLHDLLFDCIFDQDIQGYSSGNRRITFISNDHGNDGITSRYNATIHERRKNIEYWSEYQHHVFLKDLIPNTKYYYRCIVAIPSESFENNNYQDGCQDNILMPHLDEVSDDETDYEEYGRKGRKMNTNNDDSIFSFKTAPSINKHNPTKVAILGDLGVFEHSKETLNGLAKVIHDIDFIILAGDISYANGDHRIWDNFFDMLDQMKFFTQKPLYIAAGNHDVESSQDTGEMFTAYESRFFMPQVAKAEIGRATSSNDFDLNKMYRLKYDFGNSYYSFIHGISFNIILNAFADFEPESKQYQWFLGTLSGIDRNRHPWITVTVHCPMYSTFSQHHNDPQLVNLKLFLEPLLVRYKVNFILSGHVHGYSRTKTIAFDKVTKDGPIHLVLGNGGRQANAPFLNPEPEEWIAKRDHTIFGFGLIEYINATFARYEWYQTGHTMNEGDGDINIEHHMTDVIIVQNQFYV